MVQLFNCFVKLTGWLVWSFLAKPKIHYEDRSVQGRKIRGKAIVMPNHTDVWDFAAMMFLFPGRSLRCVVAELMYEKNALMSLFLRFLGTVRVDRNNNDFGFISKCVRILDKNGVVEFYPEARLPLKGQKELSPFKPSIALLALESGAPVIPVYTDGRYFSKARNHIVIGKPIDVRQLYDDGRSEKENIAAITEFLRGKINELNEQLHEELSAG